MESLSSQPGKQQTHDHKIYPLINKLDPKLVCQLNFD